MTRTGKQASRLLLLLVGGLSLVLLITACVQEGSSRPLRRRRAMRGLEELPLQERALEVKGMRRTFFLYVPPDYQRHQPLPLVLVFHGGRGSGQGVARTSEFHRLAEREGFLVAYPNGYKKNWNDGRGTTEPEREGIDDVAFVKALIDQLSREFVIDRQRIYATGISNGGIFSHRLACELADRLAAIAAVVGPMAAPVASRCRPARPVAVLGIYGTKDPFIPWEGGTVQGGDRGPILGVQATMELWAKLNQCRRHLPREALPVRVHDGTRVWKETYTDCNKGTEVVLYVVEGGGHTWPPKQYRLRQRITGASSQNIDATDVIWHFFARHAAVN
ncbi:MAG: esterase [Candidatus Tectimicrobiota bacterium]|nr:MAG: esterase [Candidatus Tectomicrobia bacterium]